MSSYFLIVKEAQNSIVKLSLFLFLFNYQLFTLLFNLFCAVFGTFFFIFSRFSIVCSGSITFNIYCFLSFPK